MPATAKIIDSNAAMESEDWSEREVSPLVESYPDEDRMGSPARGLLWGVVLSGVLWTVLIIGGREVWRLLR